MFKNPDSTSTSPECIIDGRELLSELTKLHEEQPIFNYLRTQFTDPADVVQFVESLTEKDGKYSLKEAQFLTLVLSEFKEYLHKYLRGSRKRIRQMESRNIANGVELIKHVGETDVEKKLWKTRARISKAMQFTKKPIHGKTLIDVVNAKPKRELSPEQAANIIKTLQTRFEGNMGRHEGIEWSKVQARLEANPEKLWSLQQMEVNGHEPDVYDDNKETSEYVFISTSVSEKHRNIVYDKVAEIDLKKRSTNDVCNGNAEDIAAAMGVEILDREQHKKLQKLGHFDDSYWSWVKEKVARSVPYASFPECQELRFEDCAVVFHCIQQGLRASLKV